jgi:hypothetical protein
MPAVRRARIGSEPESRFSGGALVKSVVMAQSADGWTLLNSGRNFSFGKPDLERTATMFVTGLMTPHNTEVAG